MKMRYKYFPFDCHLAQIMFISPLFLWSDSLPFTCSRFLNRSHQTAALPPLPLAGLHGKGGGTRSRKPQNYTKPLWEHQWDRSGRCLWFPLVIQSAVWFEYHFYCLRTKVQSTFDVILLWMRGKAPTDFLLYVYYSTRTYHKRSQRLYDGLSPRYKKGQYVSIIWSSWNPAFNFWPGRAWADVRLCSCWAPRQLLGLTTTQLTPALLQHRHASRKTN